LNAESVGLMNFSDTGRNVANTLKYSAFALVVSAMSQGAMAQEAAAPAAAAATPAAAQAAPAADASAYVPMAPTPGKGMPTPNGIGFQDQYSPLGDYAMWLHNGVLLPIITVIALFVLGLMLFVMARYSRRANPNPSKTSHNTLIEVVWTLVPVLILVGIAVPSIDLLAKQFKPAPKEALTVKVTGYQWYWGYQYPDNGGVEVISKMLNIPGGQEINPGVRTVGSKPWDGPSHLEVDNRLVLPAGETIRLQITGADVIHSFAVPSLWFKLDAVPGRLNEKTLFIKEPGVYYGQCSELCGVKHGYMPIAIEALPRDKFNAWLVANGGTVGGAKPAAAAVPAAAPAVPAAPAADAPAAAPAPAA
jgi:cytochrome c oxidase subunit II